MLLFEKYKTVELARFFIITATITLIVLEYEYSYNTFLTRTLDEEMKLFLYLIMFLTILCSTIYCIIFSYFNFY